MRHSTLFYCLFSLAAAAVAPLSCFAQTAGSPAGHISITALHDSVVRLEKQREELLTQLKALNAPIPFTSLEDAVVLCNSRVASHVDASHQAPLTVDELVAAVTMSLSQLREKNPTRAVKDDFADCLEKILQDRKVRMDAKLEVVTTVQTVDGPELDVWKIRLLIPTGEGANYLVLVRDSFIRVRPVTAKPSPPSVEKVAVKNAG